MSVKSSGGYVMVDCKKVNLLAQSAQTIAGLYEACTDAIKTGKPVLACNCEYGEGVPMTPFFVMMIVEAGVIIATASILQVRVANNDAVTIESLLVGGEG